MTAAAAPQAQARPSATIIDLRPELLRRHGAAAMLPAASTDTQWRGPWLETLLDHLAEAERLIDEQRERIAQLENLSMTDELTGLLNRRGFMSHFRRELSANRRGTRSGGVLLMIDLDGFKGVNDTHGHPAGDAYLRQIARLLQGAVRRQDVVGRLAGDEFAILLTDVDPDIGVARAEMLAERLNRLSVDWQGTEIPVRFSVGVAAYDPDSEEDCIMAIADRQLYGQKQERSRRRLGA